MPSSRGRAWADSRFQSEAIADNAHIDRNLLVDAPVADTLTVVRILGFLEVDVALSVDTDYGNIIDVGIGVSSVEAFAVGSAALPAPATPTEYPPRGWLYAMTKAATQFNSTQGQARKRAVFEFDLRASRKIDKGVLFLRIQNFSDSGANGVSVLGRVRVLCLT